MIITLNHRTFPFECISLHRLLSLYTMGNSLPLSVNSSSSHMQYYRIGIVIWYYILFYFLLSYYIRSIVCVIANTCQYCRQSPESNENIP
jgi:hypothetical protein